MGSGKCRSDPHSDDEIEVTTLLPPVTAGEFVAGSQRCRPLSGPTDIFNRPIVDHDVNRGVLASELSHKLNECLLAFGSFRAGEVDSRTRTAPAKAQRLEPE